MEISNYEGVSYRDDRLRKCARLAALVFGITDEQLGGLIFGLHDFKGDLYVRWHHEPSSKARVALEDVWRECNEYAVFHTWTGQPDWDSFTVTRVR
jgi:hypothetical protein